MPEDSPKGIKRRITLALFAFVALWSPAEVRDASHQENLTKRESSQGLLGTEIILAEEQGASRRVTALRKLTGTLVLTNRRLVFVPGNQRLVNESFGPEGLREIPSNTASRGVIPSVSYAVIYDAVELSRPLPAASSPQSDAVSIGLEDIVSAEGVAVRSLAIRLTGGGGPLLRVTWKDRGAAAGERARQPSEEEEKKEEFEENITGKSRRKNLNDWADVILKLKSGALNIVLERQTALEQAKPKLDTDEGKVLYLLGDMQSKSTLQLSEEAEKNFGWKIELDAIQAACNELVKRKLVVGTYEGFWDDGDLEYPPFYRKKAPLGEEYDISS
ncbi:MAG TPA: hypothetical protein VFF30_10730 [Nitrososphaerales archaeon]|nr:hypothetical protein [Nitrososphaerales archaeon]